jgi:Tol biopolymer transport system component
MRHGLHLLLGAALLCGGELGCVGAGIGLRDLPGEPIAIVHRTREETEKRDELLERRADQPRRPGTGTVRLEDVGKLLGIGADRQEQMLAMLGRLALLDPRTNDVHRIESARGGARPLCWSPDRSRLLFAGRGREGKVQLFEYRLESQEVHERTRGPESHPGGCLGPEGRLVAVQVVRGQAGPQTRLLVSDSAGGSLRPLTEGPGDVDPVWSPDGRWIAYTKFLPDGGRGIVTLQPDGTQPGRVVARGKDASFTPDAGWIVYSGRARGRWRLWRVRPDGSGKQPLGQGPFDEHDPTVAPDGRFVVFVAQEPRSDRQTLYVRRFEGGAGRPLLAHEEGTNPTW